MEHNTSVQDLEVGQEKTKNELLYQQHGWQNSALTEPLIPSLQPDPIGTPQVPDYSFTDKDGTVRNISSDVAGMVAKHKDLYEKVYQGQSVFLELKAEFDRLFGSSHRRQEQSYADIRTRSRISLSVSLISLAHFVFVGMILLAYQAGFVDWSPWTPTSWLMSVETAVWFFLVARKMLELYELDNQKKEQVDLRLNFQNMPAFRGFIGEQAWKDLQEETDRIYLGAGLVNKLSV